MIRAILFDIDGTLVDTNDMHAACWREALLRFGHDIPVETIRFQVGKGGDNLLPTLLPDISHEEQEKLEAFRGDLYKTQYMPRAVPFPGVRALFERLREEGLTLLLASSSSEAEVGYYKSLLGVEDLIQATTSKDDVESSKPCPDIFEAALTKLPGMSADEVVVIGDSPWDVVAAAKAGIRAIGFRSGGFEDRVLEEAGACALYDGPEDLLARLSTSLLVAREDA